MIVFSMARVAPEKRAPLRACHVIYSTGAVERWIDMLEQTLRSRRTLDQVAADNAESQGAAFWIAIRDGAMRCMWSPQISGDRVREQAMVDGANAADLVPGR